MDSSHRKPLHIRIPFALEEDVGLGDLIKRATTAIGIQPCGGCQNRADRLNRMLVFSGQNTQNPKHQYPDE